MGRPKKDRSELSEKDQKKADESLIRSRDWYVSNKKHVSIRRYQKLISEETDETKRSILVLKLEKLMKD